MLAVRFHEYGDASVLRLEEVPDPVPRGDEVLVRVHGSSLNPADVGSRQGRLRVVHTRGLPHTSGYDVAGEVVACGPSVTAFVPGERVYALVGVHGGGHAELARVPQSRLARAPRSLSLVEAATVPLGALTALQALRGKGRVRAGQRVLVNGASGGVGVFAVQIAKALECHVTGTASARKLEAVAHLGADEVIDYAREDFTRRPEQWDVVFDAAATSSFAAARRVLAPGGTMVTTRPDFRAMAATPLRWLTSRQRFHFLITAPRGADLALLSAWIDAGKVRPVVDRAFALEEIRAATAYFESGAATGRVAIDLGPARGAA